MSLPLGVKAYAKSSHQKFNNITITYSTVADATTANSKANQMLALT